MYSDIHFVFPIHLNPNVQSQVRKTLEPADNMHLINPLDYLEFTYLMKDCHFILTDSGGIQEEAPTLNKPVILLRGTTERPEGIAAGLVRQVSMLAMDIVGAVSILLSDESAYMSMISESNPFGDGRAASRIVKAIKDLKL